MCTLRNFPHLTDHCIEWARDQFGALFVKLGKTAEAYMDGRLVMEGGAPVFDLLYLFSINRSGLAAHPVQQALRRAWRSVRRWQQRNPLGLAAKNIRHHYDIPPAFYRMWLDETMTYSCAYYPTPEVSLHEAQLAKLRLSQPVMWDKGGQALDTHDEEEEEEEE